jgi:hypothetical protein
LDWKRGYKDEKPTVTTHFNCFVVMKWMKKREWNGTDWLVVMIFGSVWFLLKIIIKLNFFFKMKPVQTDRFWFSYFRTKTGFFWFGLVFFGLARFFWFGFGSVFFISGL